MFENHKVIAAFGVIEAKPPKPEGACVLIKGVPFLGECHTHLFLQLFHHLFSNKEIVYRWRREGWPSASGRVILTQ